MNVPLIAAAIFVVSIVAIIARPYRVPEAAVAVSGAAMMLVAGVVSPADAASSLAGSWNVFLYFLGMLLVAAIADQAGVFGWLAGVATRAAGGSAARLLLAVFGLGVLTTVIFSNDATALMLTPVVFVLVRRLDLPPKPFAFACALVANSASLLFPVANPANVLVLNAVPMTLGAFWGRLLIPGIAALAVTVAGTRFFFRADLRRRFTPPAADPVAGTGRGFRATFGGLAALGAAYGLGSWYGVPLGLVALAGAGLLAMIGLVAGTLDSRKVCREVAWGIFPFLAGMLVLITGVQTAGLARLLGELVLRAAEFGGGVGGVFAALGTALGSNVINNLPMALVAANTLHAAPIDPSTRRSLAAAVMLGVDIGPNLTVVGSLSTMLWLLLLRRGGLEISGLQYVRVGIALTPPMLLAAVATFWLTHPV
jgi:arsenical pump membrane protein